MASNLDENTDILDFFRDSPAKFQHESFTSFITDSCFELLPFHLFYERDSKDKERTRL